MSDGHAPEQTPGNGRYRLFNIDKNLWLHARESFRSQPGGGPRLQVRDGMVSDGIQILAQFKSQGSAVKTLTNAGYCRQSDGTFKA